MWALFSKYQTGKSALVITVITLAVNAFFKFLAPTLLNFSFDRAQEMGFGMGIPILLLTAFEIYARSRKMPTVAYDNYRLKVADKDLVIGEGASSGNQKGSRVIGIGVALTGLLVLVLSLLADTGAVLVGGMGGFVLLLGCFVIYRSTRKNMDKSQGPANTL